jgi:glycosyltransferase involved in cell wall biosynthesis
VILRGHQANPWELAPWEQPAIADKFDVSYLRSERGWFDTSTLALRSSPARTVRDLLPAGRVGDLAVRLPGDRYLSLRSRLTGADIVHTQELGYWYSAQAAKLRAELGFRLVMTVWETIPFLGAYRNVRTRAYRELTLAGTDMFLAATERARLSLLLEGASNDRIRVCPPGIDTTRFRSVVARGGSATPMIISPGRLVWEKGHQDVLRALALLRRGLPDSEPLDARLTIVGTGADEGRLRTYAGELGVGDAVVFRGFIPYQDMPGVYADASCLVLASLPTWCWEEQFGMVLAEAMAAGTPILASTSGAIPEVAGGAARYFSPGDWPALADLLRGALERGAGESEGPDDGAERYSTQAAAERIAAAYTHVLAGEGNV